MDLTSEQIKRFTDQFTNPSIEIKDLEKIWHRKSGTLYRWGFELGLKRPKRKGEIQLALEQVRRYCEQVSIELPPLPPIEGKPAYLGAGRKMELALLFSDGHGGRLTSTFNAVVYANRMAALGQRVADEVMDLRRSYIVKKLNMLCLGDNLTGERVGQNVTLEELEHTVMTQVYGLCIPRLVQLSNRLLLVFEDINVHAVKGNHGVLARPTPSKANWDSVVNLGWQAQMSAQQRISFNIESVAWYNYATIQGADFLLVHGDQIGVGGGNPYNNIANKVQRWHQSLPRPFDYCVMGHFHHFAQIRDTYVNATLLTDDDWCREVLAKEGDCGQLLLGLINGRIEYVKPIWLDDVGEDYEQL